MACKFGEKLSDPNDDRLLCGLSHGSGKYVCPGMCREFQDAGHDDILLRLASVLERLEKKIDAIRSDR